MATPTIATITSDQTVSFDQVRPAHIIPNGDRYLIKPVHAEQKSKSGILLQQDETSTGWFAAFVLAVGNGHRLDAPDTAVVRKSRDAEEIVQVGATVPMFFKQGDMVLVDRLAGRPITLDGQEFRIVNQVDVLAKVNYAPPSTLRVGENLRAEEAPQ